MKKLSKYLLWAFGVAWVFQIIAGILYRKGNSMSYSVLLAVSMFAPLLAAVLSGAEIRSIGWKPHIKGNIRWILVAWFAPVALGAAGAALYFLLVPNALDTTFAYICTSLGVESLSQLESAGLSVQLYACIGAVSAMTYAPFVNMLFAVGEEAGWRGTMYPILKEHFGIVKGRLIGGAVWGVWHWPIMLLAGYEYGTTYWGAPVTGSLLFCVITIAMGILFDFLYEKTNCIWVPALCHGAINAFAGVPTLFLNPAYADKLLLGPLMIGVISGLPLMLTAFIISIREKNTIMKVR
ncbi:MAG: CPBP family intramembrane metalloprotease [Lachnospiraceae bacterium]|nr:CPBP family intramembrane metalloprotease [Lachnospiraceae bacterium]